MQYLSSTLFTLWTTVNFVGLLLLLIGIALVILEMLTPGLGVCGISGAVCLIAGLFLAPNGLTEALILVCAVAVILLAALVIVMRSAYKGKLSQSPIILNNTPKKEEGYVPGNMEGVKAGDEGITLTPLRPAGIGLFNGKRLDVVSEGDFIGKDEPIRIVVLEGQRIVVDRIH